MAGRAQSRERSSLTLRQALTASPGPDSLRECVILWLKGLCMGGADIIPGVSGGTIAFITGIYGQLVDAIRSFDVNFFRRLLRLDFAGALAGVHLRFLACLLFGILTALVSMARIMNHLLTAYPVSIWAFFFGLIMASIFVVGREIKPFNAVNIFFVAVGAVVSYLLVGMIPVTTPESLPFIFLCGAIAICAMILPGISGAFLLLMLGKYEFITGTLKNPFIINNFMVIIVFAVGAAGGIMVFSRLLHFLLQRFHAATVSVLTGFMLGALRKVWPWKEVLETTVIRGKEHVLREQNVMPGQWDHQVLLAVALAVAGAVIVIGLERLSGRERA